MELFGMKVYVSDRMPEGEMLIVPGLIRHKNETDGQYLQRLMEGSVLVVDVATAPRGSAARRP